MTDRPFQPDCQNKAQLHRPATYTNDDITNVTYCPANINFSFHSILNCSSGLSYRERERERERGGERESVREIEVEGGRETERGKEREKVPTHGGRKSIS
jgi:hypothetical protein